jgi:hypothetical protein
MKNQEVLKEVITAIENKRWDTVEQKLTTDFTFSGSVPQPIDKKQWVNVHRALSTGIPDLRMNLHDVTPAGDKVKAKVQLSGTHTATLPPTVPGSKSYPSTGSKVKLPVEEIEVSFNGDKISKFQVRPVAHGGVQGLIEQIEESMHEKAL